jgi:Ca2+-binding EF-hand superfamily protein
MKTWMKWTAAGVALAGVAAGIAGTALADNRGEGREGRRGGMPMVERLFVEMDRGAKGFVTADDVTAFVDARFAVADTDKNGFVSEAEARVVAVNRSKERIDRMFDRLSRGGSEIKIEGRIANGAMGERLKSADTNKDNVLSRAEFETAAADRIGQRALGGFDMLTDGTNGVAKAKVADIAKRRFDRLDADKDGKVTKAEVRTMMMPMGGKGPGERRGEHEQRRGEGDHGPRFGMMHRGGAGEGMERDHAGMRGSHHGQQGPFNDDADLDTAL